MLQIKTIRNTDPAAFDEAVNTALREGWRLTRRLTGPDLVAEMEMELITEEEQICENCRHYEKGPDEEPCCECTDNCSAWEPIK